MEQQDLLPIGTEIEWGQWEPKSYGLIIGYRTSRTCKTNCLIQLYEILPLNACSYSIKYKKKVCPQKCFVNTVVATKSTLPPLELLEQF